MMSFSWPISYSKAVTPGFYAPYIPGSCYHVIILPYMNIFRHRTPQRQLSLYKFITSCSDLLPALLFSPFMHMLIGLSSSPNTAHCCFNFLKANSPSLGEIVCISLTDTHDLPQNGFNVA